MPETRLAKTRTTLPERYRFGDAAWSGARLRIADTSTGCRIVNRSAKTVAVERIFHDGQHWNVIEGEHHDQHNSSE